MLAFNNPGRKFRILLVAAFLCGVWPLAPGAVSAQTPLEQAWSILQAGAANKSDDQRVATMRVLQLIPGDAKAVDMAEAGLQDKDPDVQAAAALSLGAMKAKSSIPKLQATAKSAKDGAVVMAVAKALIELGDERGYSVYYAVVTGQRKSGESLVGGEEKELDEILRDPKKMEAMAFEQGIGFVPYGGYGLQIYEAIHASESKELIVKSTAIKMLAKDPDPRSGKAIVGAAKDKHWLVRAAAYDALAQRGDAALLPDILPGLKDGTEEVKLTVAAAVARLSNLPKKTVK